MRENILHKRKTKKSKIEKYENIHLLANKNFTSQM